MPLSILKVAPEAPEKTTSSITHFPVVLMICAVAILQAVEAKQGRLSLAAMLALLFAIGFGLCAFFIYRAPNSLDIDTRSSTRNTSDIAQSTRLKTNFLPEKTLVLLLQGAISFELAKLYINAIFAQDELGFVRHPEWIVPLCFVGLLVWWQPSTQKQPRLAPWWNRWRLTLLLVTFVGVVLSLLLPDSPPKYYADFYVFQHDSCAALLHGVSPYSITFRNIYGDSSPFYGPGLSVHGRLQFGYVYTPLSLLLDLPGFLLGDIRFSHLAAVAATGALIGRLRPGRLAFLAAALLLFTPTSFYMIQLGWTETFVGLTLVFALYCALHRPKLLPLALGLLLASKQYTLWLLPLFFLLWSRRESKIAWRAVATGALWAMVVTLPFVLWDSAGFFKSAILFHLRQPFRNDSLSFLVFLKAAGLPTPTWLPFVLAALVIAWVLRRATNRAPEEAVSLFSASVAVVYLVFFAFNKQAFVNYYYFVLVALMGAVAATDVRYEPISGTRSAADSAGENTN